MPHLGADVAAFVDGQLTPAATRAAEDHLAACDACARSVRQQRLVKSRMSTVAAPAPTSDLLASLTGLAHHPAPRERWWDRARRAAPLRAGVALAGASMTVAAVAYAVGGGTDGIGDTVAPPFEDYASGFFAATSTTATTASVSEATVAELNEQGWACHGRLAGDLERTQAGRTRADDTIALTYTNGTTRLKLYEQAGRLDPAAVEGFERREWGGSTVWERVGEPTVLTWDRDGIVFTIVTDADPARIRQAVDQLPAGHGVDDPPAQRVGRGLERMTAWVSAA